jgi:hypothetical protein
MSRKRQKRRKLSQRTAEYEAAPTATADKTEEATSSTTNSTAGYTLNIATDSLTSMYQIWKWIGTRPQDMQEHRHNQLYTAGHRTNY